MLESAHSVFLDTIYGQIGAENYWQLAVEAFSNCVPGGVGQVSAYGPSWGDVRLFSVPSFIDPLQIDRYKSQYVEEDIRLPAAIKHAGQAVAADDFIDVEAFEKTSLVNEFLDAKNMDVRWCAAHMEIPAKDTVVLVSMMRARARGQFDKSEVREIGRLTSHIHRATRLHLDMNQAAIHSSRLEATLDAMSDVVFVCDRHGRLIHMNEAGARCLEKGIYLSGRLGQMSAVNPLDKEPLLSSIKRAASPFTELGPTDLSVTLRSSDGSSMSLARIYPLPSHLGAYDKTSRGEVLVILKTVKSDSSAIGLALKALGLSPVEVLLTIALTEGRTLSDHASTRGVSIETIRSQLRSAMQKLGVSRQADLIRVVLQYA